MEACANSIKRFLAVDERIGIVLMLDAVLLSILNEKMAILILVSGMNRIVTL